MEALYPYFKELKDAGFGIPEKLIKGLYKYDLTERPMIVVGIDDNDIWHYDWYEKQISWISKESLNPKGKYNKDYVFITDADGLAELLPPSLKSKWSHTDIDGYEYEYFELTISKNYDGSFTSSYCIKEHCHDLIEVTGKTLTESLVKMLLWLMKEGHVMEGGGV